LARAWAPHPCAAGNALYERSLYTQAEKAYVKVFESDPCAAEGLKITQQQRCHLAEGEADAEAKKAALASEVKDVGPICQEFLGAAPAAAPADAGSSWNWSFNDLAWLLIAIGLAFLLRQIRVFSLRRRPGSIQVAELVDATGLDKIQTKAYTAQLRERLGTSGVLPPAPVPGGVLPQSVLDAVSTSPLSQASLIGKVITAISQLVWTSTAHEVSGTLRIGSYEPKFGITIQLADVGSGATESVATIWRKSHRDAVRDAAFYVYDLLLTHPDILGATPVWQRWTAANGEGVSHFQGARWEESTGDVDKAIDQYRLAAALEPRNALVREGLGGLLETKSDVLGAMEQYLTVALHWPELAIPSYRLGAAYAAHERLVEAWQKAGQKKLKMLARLIDRVESEHLPRTDDDAVKVGELSSYFLNRSLDRWRRLSYTDIERKERIDGRALRIASRVAECITKLQLAIAQSPQPPRDVLVREFERQKRNAKFYLGRRPDWVGLYNLACLLSQAAAIPHDDPEAWKDWKEECAASAVEELDHVVRDQRCTLKLAWMCEDPDLKPIAETSAFKAWSHILACSDKSRQEVDVTSRLEKIRVSWQVLSAWARDLPAAWRTRIGDVNDWNGVQFRECESWCELERIAWSRLAHWAGEPLDDGRRPEVWNAFRKASGEDDPGELKLPDLGDWSQTPVPTKSIRAQELELEQLWEELRQQALKLSECWRDRGQRAERQSVSLANVEKWTAQARDTWETLADWAAEPTETSVERRFDALVKSCS
jgi:tetratricopeptide (TPR) repeat protein